MKCPNCGYEVTEGSLFCGNCGRKMEMPTGLRCPRCGAENDDDALFCEQCGAKLASRPEQKAVSKPVPTPEPKSASQPVPKSVPKASVMPREPKENTAPAVSNFFNENKKLIIGVVIAAVLAIGGFFAFGSASESGYQKACVSVSGQLQKENAKFLDNAKKYMGAASGDERAKVVSDMKASVDRIHSMKDSYSKSKVPSKYNDVDHKIKELFDRQATIYEDVLTIYESTAEQDIDKKVEGLSKHIEATKQLARDLDAPANSELKIPGTAFADAVRDNDSLASVVMKHRVRSQGSGATGAFTKYHKDISSHHMNDAYNAFSDGFKAKVPYSGWVSGYNTTISSEPSNIKTISSNDSQAQLSFTLKARDRANGKILVQVFEGTCTLVKANNQWKIDEIISKKISERYE